MDKTEKRRIIKVILGLYIPFTLILFTATNLFSFILFRIYHAFLATSLWLAGETYLRQHSKKGKESEASGLFDSLSGAAYVAGPVIGALLISLMGFSFFHSISVFSTLALIISFALPDHGKSLKDGLKLIKPSKIIKEVKEYFSNKEIAKLSLINFLIIFAGSFIGMTLPLFLNNLGASYFSIGIIYAAFSIPILFESFFASFKRKNFLVLMCISAAAVICTFLFVVNSIILVFVLTILLGIALAGIYPILFGKFTKLMPKDKIGKFSAVNFSVRQLAAGLGPITAGIVADIFGINRIFILATAVFIFVLALIPEEF